ncbi:unnamed protein product, partial [Mesorhabditis spiculigera]
MGNEQSHKVKKTHGQSASPSESPRIDSRSTEAAKKLADSSGKITAASLQSLFSPELADSLWKYLSEGQGDGVTPEAAASKITPLMGTSTDIYVKICQPVHHFIKVCLEAAGGVAYDVDVGFIQSLVKKMTAHGDNWESIVEWKNSECPRFCHQLQSVVLNKLNGYPVTNVQLNSDVLSQLQFLYLQSALPPSYFVKDPKTGELAEWIPIYTSAMQGISVNRFENNVFEYKGHTVTVIKLKDKRTVALASDTTFRNGSTRYGGNDTMYFELEPSLLRLDGTNSIYSNFKIRSASMGLSFKEVMKIDKDLDEVVAIEVWGCGGASTLNEQRGLRDWQNRQAERNKKVPLPGNWDDNPDKTLLEMAGINFSNERANMEMEARRRAEMGDG